MDSSRNAGGGGGGGNPFAWLGLLKWSLSYTDGTSAPSENAKPMSDEDRKFLESVMKEGIIDENDRMKEILKQVAGIMEKWKVGVYSDDESIEVENLMQELRDIVEQIDYARAFAAMNGLEFLLGCAQEMSNKIPRSCRIMSLGIIATMCQHNPPVQKKLLEMGSLKQLSDLFFEMSPDCDSDGSLRARIVQAVSANVRSNDLAEEVFCHLEQATTFIACGLGMSIENSSNTPPIIRQRTLFFLRALITSDSATRGRVQQFAASICWTLDNLVTKAIQDNELEILEIILSMTEQILEQRKSVNAVLSRKESITSIAVQRISAIRSLSGEEKEIMSHELEYWERILILLSGTQNDSTEPSPLQVAPSDQHSNLALAQ